MCTGFLIKKCNGLFNEKIFFFAPLKQPDSLTFAEFV